LDRSRIHGGISHGGWQWLKVIIAKIIHVKACKKVTFVGMGFNFYKSNHKYAGHGYVLRGIIVGWIAYWDK